jgi:hypothetical protein
MRVLLLHPYDTPTSGIWKDQHWDLIVDLGWAGSCVYEAWTREAGVPVRGLFSYGHGLLESRRLAEMFASGRGTVVDSQGVDWWDLFAPVCYDRLQFMLLLHNLLKDIPAPSEVRVTQDNPLALSFSRMLQLPVRSFRKRSPSWPGLRLSQVGGKAWNLGGSKLGEIALDKWDSDYRFRRLLGRSRPACSEPQVLIPSAYANVSRVACRYASVLPKQKFLLVTTRPGGRLDPRPPNVNEIALSAFAPARRDTQQEADRLTSAWRELEQRQDVPEELKQAFATGIFSTSAKSLHMGLVHRDAWRSVFESESISAVFCADENNPYTRLPAVLARLRSIPTVYCAHGALDMSVLMRGICSDWYLAKGEMERDYLQRVCEVPGERVFVGGDAYGEHGARHKCGGEGSTITFFSEPYELFFGRTAELYREVLPPLAKLARLHKKRLLLKLHPFESERQRTRCAQQVLSAEDYKLLEITKEPMSAGLLERTWFGVTFESSVAVECAISTVPCFICHWFDLGWYGYSAQYAKFGAARLLRAPEELARIPELIGEVKASIQPQRLTQQINVRLLTQRLASKLSPEPVSPDPAIR